MSTEHDLILKAMADAERLYAKHFRKDGVTPCFVHISNVLATYTAMDWDGLPGLRQAVVAIHHDTLEDGHMTEAELLAYITNLYTPVYGTSAPSMARIDVNDILALTRGIEEDYHDFIRRLVAYSFGNGCRFVRLIKLADILDNLSDDPSKAQREKYRKAISIINGSVS